MMKKMQKGVKRNAMQKAIADEKFNFDGEKNPYKRELTEKERLEKKKKEAMSHMNAKAKLDALRRAIGSIGKTEEDATSQKPSAEACSAKIEPPQEVDSAISKALGGLTPSRSTGSARVAPLPPIRNDEAPGQ